MLVRDRMSSPAVTVTPETPFQDALKAMRDHKFRRLVVVDREQKLVGIVSERDLLHASPSPATSLSIWELNYLLAKLRIGEIMTKDVFVVAPDTPVEDAARMMVEHKIGGLPVVDGDHRIIGVITETDIFRAFVEMLSGGQPGLRMVLEVPSQIGTLAKLASAIAALQGNIVSVGTFSDDRPGNGFLLIKVAGVSSDQLVETLEGLGDHVLDVREV